MGRMNLGRVVAGGILAGIVIDIWEGLMRGILLQKQGAAIMAALGKPGGGTPHQIVAFNIWGLAVGVLTIWLYAAIRPRMGAGPRTAMLAGIFVWALVFALGVMPSVITHLLPVEFGVTTVCAEAIMMLFAGLAGGWLYKEAA